MTSTWFIAAKTTAAEFARITGLVEGRGFVVERGFPTGLYPDAMGRRIHEALMGEHVGHHIVSAGTYNEGRKTLPEATS